MTLHAETNVVARTAQAPADARKRAMDASCAPATCPIDNLHADARRSWDAVAGGPAHSPLLPWVAAAAPSPGAPSTNRATLTSRVTQWLIGHRLPL